jgi:hypothetical protein
MTRETPDHSQTRSPADHAATKIKKLLLEAEAKTQRFNARSPESTPQRERKSVRTPSNQRRSPSPTPSEKFSSSTEEIHQLLEQHRKQARSDESI